MKKIVVGLTGATGMPVADRLVRVLLGLKQEVRLVMSENGTKVFEDEMGIDVSKNTPQMLFKHFKGSFFKGRLKVSDASDFCDAISSGSSLEDGMVIVPCSMSTVGAIASGITLNLIHRAASVCLKERRPLILATRESPMSPVHLKNLLYLSEIGVRIVPITLAFYHRPKSVEQMIDFSVGKILDQLGIPHELFARWKGCRSS